MSDRPVGQADYPGPYLTVAEAACLARLSTKRLRNLMASQVLQEGTHFVRPRGLHPRFKRDALEKWLEGRDDESVRASPALRPSRQSRCKIDLSLARKVEVKK